MILQETDLKEAERTKVIKDDCSADDSDNLSENEITE